MPRFPHRRGRIVRRRKPIGVPLPFDRYGVFAGEYHHQTLTPMGKPNPDDNHVYLWVKIPDAPGRPGGVYECAFNIHSSRGSHVQFAELEEELDAADLPAPGFYEASLSYKELGLANGDFAPVRDGDLHVLVTQYAERCDLMAAYGVTYSDGAGLHDLHMRSGEPPRSPYVEEERPDEDGALVFYFLRSREPTLVARWVLVKFETQSLSR